jgi:hypothetical protein
MPLKCSRAGSAGYNCWQPWLYLSNKEPLGPATRTHVANDGRHVAVPLDPTRAGSPAGSDSAGSRRAVSHKDDPRGAGPAENRDPVRAARLVRAEVSLARGNPAAALSEVDRLLAEIDYPCQRTANRLAPMLIFTGTRSICAGPALCGGGYSARGGRRRGEDGIAPGAPCRRGRSTHGACGGSTRHRRRRRRPRFGETRLRRPQRRPRAGSLGDPCRTGISLLRCDLAADRGRRGSAFACVPAICASKGQSYNSFAGVRDASFSETLEIGGW